MSGVVGSLAWLIVVSLAALAASWAVRPLRRVTVYLTYSADIGLEPYVTRLHRVLRRLRLGGFVDCRDESMMPGSRRKQLRDATLVVALQGHRKPRLIKPGGGRPAMAELAYREECRPDGSVLAFAVPADRPWLPKDIEVDGGKDTLDQLRDRATAKGSVRSLPANGWALASAVIREVLKLAGATTRDRWLLTATAPRAIALSAAVWGTAAMVRREWLFDLAPVAIMAATYLAWLLVSLGEPIRFRRSTWAALGLGAVLVLASLVVLPRGEKLTPSSAEECVSLTLWSSTEPGKARDKRARDDNDPPGVLEKAAADFSKTEDVDGRCARVKVFGFTSGKAELALEKNGGGKQEWKSDIAGGYGAPKGWPPAAWLPSDLIWLKRLQYRSRGASEDYQDATVLEDIASSPIVLAVTPQGANAIKRAEPDSVTIDEIAEAARLGDLKLIKENPNYSTSGAAATLIVDKLARNQGDDPRARDGLAGVIERAVVTYPDDIIETLKKMAATEDPPALAGGNALFGQKSLVTQYGNGSFSDGKKPLTTLTPLTLTDGTMRLDHPFVLLPWAQADEKKAAEAFHQFLMKKEWQKKLREEGFDGPDEETDNNLFADGEPTGAEIDGALDNWAQLRRPARLSMLLDTSGSLQKEWPQVRSIALSAIQRIGGPNDQYAVAAFPGGSQGTTRSLVDFRPVADGVDLPDNLGRPVPGESPVFAAIRGAADKTRTASRDATRRPGTPDEICAVLVVTDGRQNPDLTEAEFNDIKNSFADNDDVPVQVFVVLVGKGPKEEDKAYLKRLAEVTSVALYTPASPDEVARDFDKIVKQLGARQ
ncbi:MAG: substrate-binding domain-containing protein [Nocardioides sp.]